MNYSFKVTTGGRELLAALLATGKELEITRVAVGSGKVAEDTNLADMTELIQYVAEGTIAQRRHQDNVLYLTVQYSSNSTPGLGAFYLAEFIVEARHPISGESVVLLYATLGDYIQPVNAYSESLPPDIRNYPLAIAISDEIEVTITTPAGLVTYDDLQEAVDKACRDLVNTMATGGIKKSIDFVAPAADWVEDPNKVNGYGFYYDLADEDITDSLIPDVVITEGSQETAKLAGMSVTATTYAGYARLKCVERPKAEIVGTCHLLGKGVTGGGGSAVVGDLPVATSETLGGVKVQEGSGLKIDTEGNLSVDTASEEESTDAINDIFTDEARENAGE